MRVRLGKELAEAVTVRLAGEVVAALGKNPRGKIREIVMDWYAGARPSDGTGSEMPITASKRAGRQRTLRVRSANPVPRQRHIKRDERGYCRHGMMGQCSKCELEG